MWRWWERGGLGGVGGGVVRRRRGGQTESKAILTERETDREAGTKAIRQHELDILQCIYYNVCYFCLNLFNKIENREDC